MRLTALAVALLLAPVVARAQGIATTHQTGGANVVVSNGETVGVIASIPDGGPQAICIQGAVCVANDGTVTMQPGVTPTLAAKRFWNAVAQVRGRKLPFPEIAR